jgi:hypothetical protein
MLNELFLAASSFPSKKNLPPRLPIATLIVLRTAQAIKKMFPTVRRLYLVGSRLRHKYGRDLEFVAEVDRLEDMPGRNVIGLYFGTLKVDLFFSLPDEVDTHILEFGLGRDIMRWKRTAIRKGLKLNRFGLWKGPRKITGDMKKIAAILGLPLKPHLVFSRQNPL